MIDLLLIFTHVIPAALLYVIGVPVLAVVGFVLAWWPVIIVVVAWEAIEHVRGMRS